MVSDFAQRAEQFERNVTDALLQKGVLSVRLRLPVPAPGRAVLANLLQRARTEKTAAFEQERVALEDAVETCVAAYEAELVARNSRRAGDAAAVGTLPALSPMERTAIRAFLMWAVVEDMRMTRKGTRLADLDSVTDLLVGE